MIMGKRSDFERRPRDFYPTPIEAVEPLVPHLPNGFTFAEPCAGNGALVLHLESGEGHCMWTSDIEPQQYSIETMDYSQVGEQELIGSDYIITNPPWDRKILHPMIDHFSKLKPTWLLFDADWMHTIQAKPYLVNCEKIVSVGRIKWFGNMTGKDNCAWYLFRNKYEPLVKTEFYGR